jgi:hypothetical protein
MGNGAAVAVADERTRSGFLGAARTVMAGVKAANRFSTLRDLIGTDAYIEESRLKMLRALGDALPPLLFFFSLLFSLSSL